MKRSLICGVVFFLFLSAAFPQDTLRKVNNKAFTHGEFIKFKVYYGWVNAGFATLKIHEDPSVMSGRQTYRVVGIGESSGTFDWFFKVRDRYETYIDKSMIAPIVFIRRVDEGGYIIKQDYVFNHSTKKLYDGKQFIEIPSYVQDMISAYYYARTLDYTNIKPGDVIAVKCYVDDSTFTAKLKFVKRENLKTDLGTFRCMVFRPVIQTGRIFKHEEDMNVWITDDENKIPIRAEAKILVGSIKMDLIEYSGLANPISKIE